MIMMEMGQSCLECSSFKFNGFIKMPSEDGFDCVACNRRIVDFYLIRNGSADGMMKRLYPPYGIPDFCPIIKDFVVEAKEEMEFV